MKQKTEQLIADFYKEMEYNSPLKEVFKEVLIKYVEFHDTPSAIIYDGQDSLFCSIHSYFNNQEGHNCVGCNMNESNSRIENFLLGYRLFNDEYATFTSFIFLLYLQVEQIFEYFEIIELPESYKFKHFQPFIDVKRWANFLKHPKTFILVHHPIWTFEGYDEEILIHQKPVIDTAFVNKYYGGDRNNKDLSKLLFNKEGLAVIFPNPLILIDRFCAAQKKFVNLIKDNQMIREALDDKATIREYYNSLAEVETDQEEK